MGQFGSSQAGPISSTACWTAVSSDVTRVIPSRQRPESAVQRDSNRVLSCSFMLLYFSASLARLRSDWAATSAIARWCSATASCIACACEVCTSTICWA